jgi:hypothetical protein
MNPRSCKTIHNPPESYGDCVRACIATLTDDDSVPHIFDKGIEAEAAWKLLRAYLSTKGKKLAAFTVDNVQEWAEDNPDIPYMLVCGRIDGSNHAVVGINGRVVHDPAWTRVELCKHPTTNSWIIFLVI